MLRQNNGERGKVSVPAKRVPYGKPVRITDEGSRAEGSRLAAEDGVSDPARRWSPPIHLRDCACCSLPTPFKYRVYLRSMLLLGSPSWCSGWFPPFGLAVAPGRSWNRHIGRPLELRHILGTPAAKAASNLPAIRRALRLSSPSGGT